MTQTHAMEMKEGKRFGFGENWTRFLSLLDEARIKTAEESLKTMLNVPSLGGKTFLDIGSGSGLFSLAAARLGARVRSFDYDPQSVFCTRKLKDMFFKNSPEWTIDEGSVLDKDWMAGLGSFDVVYSWGVLHHTGNMAGAFANVVDRVAPNGQLFIAIYNDQGWISRYWHTVKKLYNRGGWVRTAVTLVHMPYLFALRWVVRALTGRLSIERGMSLWVDAIDWLGGYPFEVAKPEGVFDFFHARGFTLEKLRTCGGRMGCNEFVFRRTN